MTECTLNALAFLFFSLLDSVSNDLITFRINVFESSRFLGILKPIHILLSRDATLDSLEATVRQGRLPPEISSDTARVIQRNVVSSWKCIYRRLVRTGCFRSNFTLPLRAQQGYGITLSSQNLSRKYEQFSFNSQ